MTRVFVLSVSGLETGRRVADALDAELEGRFSGVDRWVDDHGGALRESHAAGEAIVHVGALGALVRLLAPVLGPKATDPPVIAVAEDASAVIPVLGGHHGANDLARKVGGSLGVTPAITTASDLAFGVALDDPPEGWHLANPENYKSFMTRLLSGEAVRLEGSMPWLEGAALPIVMDSGLTIRASDRAAHPVAETLTYHPEHLALGVGCERDTEPSEVIALAEATLAEAGLAPESVAAVVSVDLKMDEPAVHALAIALNRPARFFKPERLDAETPRLENPSKVVFRAVGCHGVAEAAALAAAGPDGMLLVDKRKSKRATCAIARAERVIDAMSTGAPRGRLFVVGIGPGIADWRTPEVDRMVTEATDLVGYSLYLDLLGSFARGKTCHDFQIGQERDRVIAALNLAAQGKTVALVSSGDPGIYAMASLVFECLETGGRVDWNRLAVEIAPGISAMQACAARVGAPLGHDFCAISLSDLLIPWAVIENRLHAAADGDFVVALYNPASERRRWQIVRALEVLGAKRPSETPVILARALGRSEEAISVTQLIDFDTGTVDMLSLVMVGNSQTRIMGRWVHTPRGYGVGGRLRR